MQKDNQNISEEEILNNNIEEISNNNDGKNINNSISSYSSKCKKR